jgi:hypothetical protein
MPLAYLQNDLRDGRRETIEEIDCCIDDAQAIAPKAQCWLAPRFSVGKVDSRD